MTGFCPHCFLGRLKIENRLFMMQDGLGVLIAPQTLALVCDQCDFLEFDPAAIEQIGALLDSPVANGRPQRSGELPKRLLISSRIERSHEIQ